MSMTPELRPSWQAKRGERFGNLRKQEALWKVQQRRMERARAKGSKASKAEEF